jgi:N-acyl homoserine lactone hydrolase
VHCQAQDTIGPIRRLKQIAAERGYPLIPGHDPHVWPALIEQLTPGALQPRMP